MRRFRNPQLLTASLAMLVLAGCASTGTPATATNATGSTAPTATSGPSSPASVAPSAPTSSKPSVDLTFTGSLAFVAKGSAGQCTLGTDAAGNVNSFGFGATEADYPGLGEGFYVNEGEIKWVVGAGVGYVISLPTHVETGVTAISADHHSITLDVDLVVAALNPGHEEHVAGTIVCP